MKQSGVVERLRRFALFNGLRGVHLAHKVIDNERCRTSLKSAGEATKLTLLPESDIVGPEELCYLRLQYTDGAGTVKPLACGEIKARVEGGSLLALGSACSYDERGYPTDTTDTYYGEALAIVKPNGTGTVTVHAESPYGGASAEIACGERGGDHA